MMTSKNQAGVWILSIHDMAPQGFLAFDLKEVLVCLGSAVQDYVWLITELDCLGEGAQRLCEQVSRASGVGVVWTGLELLAASAMFSQTINATLIGVPKETNASENLSDLGHVELFPESRAEVIIRAVDSSFFEVMTKNPDHVQALQARFKDVRVEETEKYFAALGSP